MKFNIILADPPWLYDDARTAKSAGMARSAYECMPIEDILALPVQDITDDDCMLCLWATMPKLQEALWTIKAWGFRYVTCGFVWIKANASWQGFPLSEKDIWSGMGHYTNQNAELLLLGRKEKGEYWREYRNVKQVLITARRSHSEKPDEIYDKIVKLFGDYARVELFARQHRPGWVSLGLEIDGKTMAEAIKELGALS